MPDGWIYPIFHANSTHRNKTIEKPTRKANARTMLLVLASPLRPSRIMKNNATPKLPMMATKAKATIHFMAAIIGLVVTPCPRP